MGCFGVCFWCLASVGVFCFVLLFWFLGCSCFCFSIYVVNFFATWKEIFGSKRHPPLFDHHVPIDIMKTGRNKAGRDL